MRPQEDQYRQQYRVDGHTALCVSIRKLGKPTGHIPQQLAGKASHSQQQG